MKKATLFFNLTVSMFLLGLTMAVSGFVLWLAFPSGGGGGGGHGRGGGGELTFWELSKHKWIVRMSKQFITQTATQLRGAYPRPVVPATKYLVSGAAIPVESDCMPGRQS